MSSGRTAVKVAVCASPVANGGPGQVFAARGRDRMSDQLQEEPDMVSMAGAELVVTSQETGPEQLPASSDTTPAELPAPAQRDQLRPLEVAQCAMCGIALPLGLLVPDGGQGCADIRWYCKDARSCTERWTSERPPRRATAPEVASTAFAGVAEPAA